jgi:ATP-dependent helicase/nuclease subunit A
MPLADEHARKLIHTVLDRNLVVEAAAGTGKTSELVKRMIATLENGRTTIDRIIAVTFTEKAAGELKLRVHAALEQARLQSSDLEKKHRIEHALARLDEARISTIHALCIDLLRERPVEAQLDPQFEVLTESAGRRLYRQAFRSWFQRCLENPPEGVRRFLRRRTWKPAADVLMDSGRGLAEWRDFTTPWRRKPFNREEQVDTLTKQLHEFASLTKAPLDKNNNFYKTTAAARLLSSNISMAEAGRPRDYDDLEAIFVNVLRDNEYDELREPKNGPARFNEDVSQSSLQEKHTDWLQGLRAFVTLANADLAALLQIELNESIAEYQALKTRAGQVDFLDLLIETRNLLVRSQSVRKHFQERFSHLFVDEFQDTDPIQADPSLVSR